MIDWLRPDARLRRDAPRTIELGSEVLPVEIRRHPTARRMVLRLAPDGESVRVTIPRWGRVGDALRFAQDRSAWLAQQRAQLPQRNAPEPGGTLAYRGSPLTIGWDETLPRKVRLDGDTLRLGGPRETLAPRLKRWLQAEARRLLADDLAFYSDCAGLDVPPLALSSARRRWGSCSSSGAMRINWRLVMAPDAVRRSVVAHETAHRVYFDHSPAFHALLGQLYEGDLPAADRWLKTRGPTLFSPFG